MCSIGGGAEGRFVTILVATASLELCVGISSTVGSIVFFGCNHTNNYSGLRGKVEDSTEKYSPNVFRCHYARDFFFSKISEVE